MKSLCLGFFEWFVLKRKQKFIENVIVSARDGTDLDGSYYQNYIESIHFIEKMQQCFSKKSVNEVIKSFESFYDWQEQEEVRAFYRAGLFSVATEYEKFKAGSKQWHQWSMKKRQEHVKRFRNYKLNLTDAYKKPGNSGRKPGAYTKSKRPNTEPDIVVDRLSSENL